MCSFWFYFLSFLEDIFIENWSLKSSEYEVYNISYINFNYMIINETNSTFNTKINQNKSIQ